MHARHLIAFSYSVLHRSLVRDLTKKKKKRRRRRDLYIRKKLRRKELPDNSDLQEDILPRSRSKSRSRSRAKSLKRSRSRKHGSVTSSVRRDDGSRSPYRSSSRRGHSSRIERSYTSSSNEDMNIDAFQPKTLANTDRTRSKRIV